MTAIVHTIINVFVAVFLVSIIIGIYFAWRAMKPRCPSCHKHEIVDGECRVCHQTLSVEEVALRKPRLKVKPEPSVPHVTL